MNSYEAEQQTYDNTEHPDYYDVSKCRFCKAREVLGCDSDCENYVNEEEE